MDRPPFFHYKILKEGTLIYSKHILSKGTGKGRITLEAWKVENVWQGRDLVTAHHKLVCPCHYIPPLFGIGSNKRKENEMGKWIKLWRKTLVESEHLTFRKLSTLYFLFFNYHTYHCFLYFYYNQIPLSVEWNFYCSFRTYLSLKYVIKGHIVILEFSKT